MCKNIFRIILIFFRISIIPRNSSNSEAYQILKNRLKTVCVISKIFINSSVLFFFLVLAFLTNVNSSLQAATNSMTNGSSTLPDHPAIDQPLKYIRIQHFTYRADIASEFQSDKYGSRYLGGGEFQSILVPIGSTGQHHQLFMDLELNAIKNKNEYVKGFLRTELYWYKPNENSDWYFDDFQSFWLAKNPNGFFISKADFSIVSPYAEAKIYKWSKHSASDDFFKLFPADENLLQNRFFGNFNPMGVEIKGKENFFLKPVMISYNADSTLFAMYNLPITSNFFVKLLYSQRLTGMFMYHNPLYVDNYDPIHNFIKGHFTLPQTPPSQLIYDDLVWGAETGGKWNILDFRLEGLLYNAASDSLKLGAKIGTGFMNNDIRIEGHYMNAGVYAGNKEEYGFNTSLNFMDDFIFKADAYWQNPMHDPLYFNLLTPPLVLDNREASVYSGSLTWDTSHETDFNSDNANDIEDAPLAMKISYTFKDFPTYTDTPVNIDWERYTWSLTSGIYGRYPCQLYDFSWKGIMNIMAPLKIIGYFGMGFVQANQATLLVSVPWTTYRHYYMEASWKNKISLGILYSEHAWDTPAFGSAEDVYRIRLPYWYADWGLPLDNRLVALFKIIYLNTEIIFKYEYDYIDPSFNQPYMENMNMTGKQTLLGFDSSRIVFTFNFKY